MADENVELAQRWSDAFNRRDFDAIPEFFDPSIEWRTPHEDPDQTTYRGQAAVRGYIEGVLDVFPDLRFEVDEFVEAPDGRVISTAHFVGRSASGVPTDYRLTFLATVRSGLFSRIEEYYDRDEALEAAGLRT